MRIEIKLAEDKPTQMPYWTAKLIHQDNERSDKVVVVEVVSKTFNPLNEVAFKEQYENTVMSMLKHMLKEKDQMMLKHLLINDFNA